MGGGVARHITIAAESKPGWEASGRGQSMLYRDCFQHLYGVDRKRILPTPADDLRLHRLERPEPWQARLMEAIWAAQGPIQQYPDYDSFHERLARFVGRRKEKIVIGAGIEDFIRSLFLLCCDPGDTVAYTWPTCAMFDVYADVFGANPTRIISDPESDLTAERINRHLLKAKLLILPNPGQPVDSYLPPDEMREVAKACRRNGTVLAIDEAYHGFGTETCLPLVDEFDNVLVLRTFSKMFGAAGIRVGYAVGDYRAIKPLDAIRESGEIAGPSMAAASVLMDCWIDVKRSVEEVCAGRDWLREKLTADGFKARGSNANHVLVDMGSPERAASVGYKLRKRGVHVRNNVAPLDRHIMVTCGSVGLMQRFYEVFCSVL